MGKSSRARAAAMAVAGVLIASVLALAVPTASYADDGGSITGHVRLDGGGPLPSSAGWTWAYATPVGGDSDPYGPDAHSSEAPIGADGAFTISGLDAGQYLVQTRWGCDCYPALRPHFDEFYGDAATASAATPVAVAAGRATTGIDISVEPAASLTGSLQPTTATLTVYQKVGTTWSKIAPELTREGGFYALGGLHSGTYAIGAAASGYCTRTPDATGADRATPVTLTAPTSATSDVRLTSATSGCGPAVTSSTPSITGTARVGETLTVKAGTWQAGAALTYQWFADKTRISGATASRFTATAAQRGKALTVSVTGRLAGHTTVAKTSRAIVVAAGVLKKTTATISGTVAIGATLTAKPGTWTSGTTLSYQWYAASKAISKATSRTYKIASSQLGKRIKVKVTGKKSGYTTTSTVSKETAKAAKAATPSVSGSARVGAKLSVKKGTWTTGTSFSYRWYANGKAISKATKSTYVVSSARVGTAITVKVTGKKPGYATVSKTSKATRKVPKVATPSISGTRAITRTLTAKPGAWTSGTSFTYKWYANGKAISKATKKTLKLGRSLLGKKITVTVTGKRSGYTTVAKTSKKTGKIGYPSRTAPVSSWNCPSWAPIKGNANSGIYHLPGQRFYKATKPEDCFRTEAAARNAGYRKAKV